MFVIDDRDVSAPRAVRSHPVRPPAPRPVRASVGPDRLPVVLLLAFTACLLAAWWTQGWPRLLCGILSAGLAAGLVMDSALGLLEAGAG